MNTDGIAAMEYKGMMAVRREGACALQQKADEARRCEDFNHG